MHRALPTSRQYSDDKDEFYLDGMLRRVLGERESKWLPMVKYPVLVKKAKNPQKIEAKWKK